MRNFTALCLFAFFTTTTLLAQDLSIDTSMWSIALEDVVVTAQYAPTDSRNAVHHIRTIKQTDIQQRGVTNLEQLLRQELNIRISQDMILGSSINLQGVSGQNVQIMIDGVPMIGRVGDDVDLGQVNLNNIERVEIVEGPLSVDYGTNALGGVINLITKKSQLKRFDAQVNSQWGSVGRLNLDAALGVRPVKSLLIRVNGGRNDFRGYTANETDDENAKRTSLWNPKEQYFAGGSVRYDFAETHQLRYAINYFDEEVINLGEIRRPEYKPYAFDDYYFTNRLDNSLYHEGKLSDKFFIKTNLAYNNFERQKNTYRLNFDENEQELVDNEQDTTIFNTFVFRPVIASTFKNSKVNFQLGVDIHYGDAKGKRINDPEASKDNYSEMGDYAVFTSVKYEALSNMTLQAGLRAAHNTRYDAPLVPSFNVRYAPVDELTIRASYARGFRAPSLKELYFYFVDASHFLLGNSNLKAENSDNYQLALTWKPKKEKNKLELTAKAYYNQIENKIDLFQFVEVDGEIVPATEIDQASVKYAYFNQTRYKTLGGDLRANYTWKNFELGAGLSPIGRYNVLSETMDDVSTYTFVYETNGQLSYHWPKQNLDVAFYLRHNDKLVRYYQDYDEEDNPITGQSIQDGFTLADLTVSKTFWKKRIRLLAGAQNVFDVKNVNVNGSVGGGHGGGGAIAVGMGRSYFVNLSWNLAWD